MEKKRFDSLLTSLRWSDRKMQPYRGVRYAAIAEYTGRLYGDKQDDARIPLNFIEMAVTIYLQHLAAKRPTALVTTKFPSLKQLSLAFEHAVNDYMKSIHVERTFQRSVLNAIFGMGVIKVGNDAAVTMNWDDIKDDRFLKHRGIFGQYPFTQK